MIFPAHVRTLPDLIRYRAEVQPGRVAICDGDRTTTYGQLDQRSSRVAQSLYQHGLEPGERVGVLDRDCDDLFTVVFGISKASGVVLGMDWRLTASELAFQLEDAGVRTLFVGAEFVEVAEALMSLCPKLRTVVTFGQEDRGWTTLSEFLGEMPAANPCTAVDPESVAVQMYTSGTTGRPKGVMLAHRSFFAITGELAKAEDPWIGWHEHDVTMCGMPSFHIGGMWWAMTSFHAGACYVVLDSFSGWKALRKIERHLVTKLCLVPAMLQVCMSEPEFAGADVSSVECIVYGGSPIPRPLLEQAMRAFGCDFAQIYGLT
ncbi:MAG: AMP-binding protein, partial [Planctomycetota bacterium]|nr:AMP-binding protein [Planctomycetota bacterium]